MEIAWTMHRGRCERQQDAILVDGAVFQRRNRLPQSVAATGEVLVAVADGVAAGPWAARTSRTLAALLPQVLRDGPDRGPNGLIGPWHVREAHRRLCASIGNDDEGHGGATTLVALHVRGSNAAVVNVGDSRAYLVRQGESVRQISRDHTELQALRDSGVASADGEYASIYSALSDCLVADPEADVFDIHHVSLELQQGDIVLLCSDGVHDVLGDGPMQQAFVQGCGPLAIVSDLRSEVAAQGAPDILSIIAVRTTTTTTSTTS